MSLKDLLIHAKHYSAGTRKDALVGMMDLFSKFPVVVVDSLGVILASISKLIVDEDFQVRATLLNLFKSHFNDISEDNIIPFFPTLMAYQLSAMSHIKDDIRIDSLKFLEFWCKYRKLVVYYSDKIIDCYLKMISVKGSKVISLVDNPKSKLSKSEVLSSLVKYISLLHEENQSNSRSEEVVDRIYPWTSHTFLQPKPLDCFFLFNQNSAISYHQVTSSLLSTLCPILLQAWVENASSLNLDKITLTPEIMSLLTVLKTMKVMWSLILSAPESFTEQNCKSFLADIQKRVSLYFPFGRNLLTMDQRQKAFLNEMNIELCELLSLFTHIVQYAWIEEIIIYSADNYIKLNNMEIYERCIGFMNEKEQLLKVLSMDLF